MNRKSVLPVLLLLACLGPVFGQQSPVGWAAANGGTTGGAGGETVEVTTRAAFAQFAGMDAPYIIRVRDTIELDLYERVKIKGNKTVLGSTVNAMLRYGGLEISGDNVIVRNLIIGDSYDGDWEGKTHSTDAVTITGKNVWIDHCWLTASADGLLDVRSENAAEIGDYVTVSYTRFTDHNKVSLIGSSDDATRDRGHLRTTIHHCWFDGTTAKGLHQRLPRIRYGDVHLFNNYFEDVVSYCILARLESDVVVENNYFRNCNNPHDLDDFGKGIKDPELVASGNVYEFSGGGRNSSGTAFQPVDFYPYELQDTRQLPALVMNEAGPFNAPGNRPPIPETDRVILAEGERFVDLLPTANDTDPDGDSLRLGVVTNAPEGIILIRNNTLRYLAPANPGNPDTLRYEVVDSRGGKATGSIVIDFAGVTTNTSAPLKLQGLRIYPNPVIDLLHVEFFTDRAGLPSLSLMDSSGRILASVDKPLAFASGRVFFQVPTDHLPAGIYLVKIAQSQRHIVRRIVVGERQN